MSSAVRSSEPAILLVYIISTVLCARAKEITEWCECDCVCRDVASQHFYDCDRIGGVIVEDHRLGKLRASARSFCQCFALRSPTLSLSDGMMVCFLGSVLFGQVRRTSQSFVENLAYEISCRNEFSEMANISLFQYLYMPEEFSGNFGSPPFPPLFWPIATTRVLLFRLFGIPVVSFSVIMLLGF